MPAFIELAAETIEVQYKGQPLTLEIHPDGPQMESPILAVYRVEQFQRIGERIRALEKQLYSPDGKAEEGAETRELKDDLSLEEYNRVSAQIEQWAGAGSMRPFLVDYLHASIIGWDLYASREEYEKGSPPLPVSREILNDPKRWGENDLLAAFDKITAHYNMTDAEGKESSATLQDGSETQTHQQESAPAESQASTPIISSQESTAPAPAL